MGSGVSSLPERINDREIKELTAGKMDPAVFEHMKGSDGMITKDQFLSVVNSNMDKKLEEVFLAYCPNGDMDSKTFMKLMKDCELIDKNFQPGDVDVIFQRAKTSSANGKTITFVPFNTSCITAICQKKGMEATAVRALICRREGPSFTGITRTGSIRLHDDQNTFTGQHASRAASEDVSERRGSIERRNSKGELERRSSRDSLERKGSKDLTTIKRRSSKEMDTESKPPPVSSYAGAHVVHPLYIQYCPMGDMDGRTFARMMKDAKIIDGKKFTTTDADLIYQKAKTRANVPGATGAKITFDVFVTMCLVSVADKLGKTTDDVFDILKQHEGPVYTGTVAEPNKFHDDENLYTGTKAQGGPSFDPVKNGLDAQLDRTETVVRKSTSGTVMRRRSIKGMDSLGSAASAAAELALKGAPTPRGNDDFVTKSTPRETVKAPSPAPASSGTRKSNSFAGGVTGARRGSTVIDPEALEKMVNNYHGPGETVFPVFMQFSPSGEMDSRTFMKLMKDCQIVDKKFTSGDADLVFQKAKTKAGGTGTSGARVNFNIFLTVAIPAIAEKRGEEVHDVLDTLANSVGPSFVNATKAAPNRFHDDATTYTGAHAQGGPSFDQVKAGLENHLDRSEADVRGVRRKSVTLQVATA